LNLFGLVLGLFYEDIGQFFNQQLATLLPIDQLCQYIAIAFHILVL